MADKRSRKRRRHRRRGELHASPTQGQVDEAPDQPSSVARADAGPAKAARRRADPGGPPPPPWGSFPLSELVVVVAIVMLAAGFFVGPPRGAIMLGTGLALGSLAGLELSIREHFSGYRSHTLLLAGSVAIATIAVLFAAAGVAPVVGAVAGAVAFAAATYLFAGAFRRRSGGALFKVR